ncbi:hypothetical protein [Caballeronia sp. TF1N1]|uniref:hypothetical protein n=1 Tax=Caballeronia sp. TF1N1 TaxID=2878153 RepID=UPI001FD13F2C|nr:hypothetical protein [Caballeronia sp. TF1N1]
MKLLVSRTMPCARIFSVNAQNPVFCGHKRRLRIHGDERRGVLEHVRQDDAEGPLELVEIAISHGWPRFMGAVACAKKKTRATRLFESRIGRGSSTGTVRL